jgi:hypothetical protein
MEILVPKESITKEVEQTNNRKKTGPPRKDLVGQRFGRWTVVAPAGNTAHRNYKWLCRCDCGNTAEVSANHLGSERSTSCRPCAKKLGSRRHDLTGLQFGRWSVTSFSHTDPRRQAYWNCRCECGREKPVAANMLRSAKSEGCQKCKSERQKRTAFKAAWNSIKWGATIREIEFEITPEYIFDLLERQSNSCALTGMPIWLAESNTAHKSKGTSASLDRIDSSKGYIPGNVQWLHKDVNKMKWDLTQERFIEICKIIAERQKCAD